MNSIYQLNCIEIYKENCKTTKQVWYAIYETDTKLRIICHVKHVSIEVKNNDTVSNKFTFIRKPTLAIAICFVKFQNAILLSYLVILKYLKGLSNETNRNIIRDFYFQMNLVIYNI